MSSVNQDIHLSHSGTMAANQPHRALSHEDMQVTYPSTPDRSQLSTPKMSHHNTRTVILETPPLILNTFPSPISNHLPSAPSFHSDHTPTSLGNDQYHLESLEPPAWKPPEQDEIEYVDNWNNTHNVQHHYLNGYTYSKDDSSTICSSQTNNSRSCNSRERPGHPVLRPRGFSINSSGSHKGSHFRHPSFGSCPVQPPRHGQKQHHRHESLPVALFSSNSITQSCMQPSSNQHHPLLAQQEDTKRINANAYKMIQPHVQKGPYEIYSHQHSSQIKVDAFKHGLSGALVDLYAVDRTVDEATAKMLATTSDHNTKNSRKTSMGTLKDIRTILELHRVDKMVNKFKFGLQMPVFFEEEGKDITILKELRRVDLLIGRYQQKDNVVSNTDNTEYGQQYQFDLSEDDDEGESWDQLGGVGHRGDIYLSTNSYHAEPKPDPYAFYDPHETAAMISNGYQQSYVGTTQDDLREVMDLLQCDIEIDGASQRQNELQLVEQLLEVDNSVEKWRRLAEKKRCEEEIMDLYLVDVEVNGAKNMVQTKESQGIVLRAKNPEKSITGTKPSAKEEVSRNVISLSHNMDQSNVEPKGNDRAPKTSHLPPPPVTPECTKRSIFKHREKMNSCFTVAPNNPEEPKNSTGSKRSIFTQQEKSEAVRRSQGKSG